MTELSFLIELILNHKLPKVTKDTIAARIKEVEQTAQTTAIVLPSGRINNAAFAGPGISNQSPSTQAILARNPDLLAVVQAHEPPPVAVVAQTPATVAAMNSRQQAIAESMSGKVDKQTGRPRKF